MLMDACNWMISVLASTCFGRECRANILLRDSVDSFWFSTRAANGEVVWPSEVVKRQIMKRQVDAPLDRGLVKPSPKHAAWTQDRIVLY